MNMLHSSRKEKNDPEGDSHINMAATASTGSQHIGPGDKAVYLLVSEGRSTSLVSVVQAAPA